MSRAGDLGDATATAAAIRSGAVSAAEVVEATIARIESRNPELNAVVATRFDEARGEVAAGLPVGPLTGVPIVVKDLGTAVAGLPATGGSRLFADRIASADSELVTRYKRAGMVVLGTTSSAELGKNASTEPALFGPTHNPWDMTRSPGGSSGGSASAVAGGLVQVAHGSDGGGSIRIPAAMCGLFGLKPSRGRVSGAPMPSAWNNVVSVHHALTTTVRDSALLLDVVAGGLRGDAYAAPTPSMPMVQAAATTPGRLRVGLLTNLPGAVRTHPDVVAATLATARLCEGLGHEVVEVEARYDPAEVGTVSGLLMGVDLVATVDDRLAELGRELREDDLEALTRLLYEIYGPVPATDYNRALRRAQQIGWEVGRAFDDVDLLLSPTLAQPTPPLGLLDTSRPETIYEHASTYSAYTSIYNVTGMPAMSLPLDRDSDQLPLGVQIAADLGGEGTLLSLAGQLEEAAPWQCLPPVASRP